jgi:2-dehydro-3-deoxyphosphogluconate aldolase / (4S)-4-hydroxy-2-oxoglutarate aldolase
MTVAASHQKLKYVQNVIDAGVVAVIRAPSPEQAIRIARACVDGGIRALELTFTVPNALEAIEGCVRDFASHGVAVGAGTVLDAPTARLALLAGAQFIVSPAFDAETIRMGLRYQVPVFPGATTLAGIIEALEAGADIVKVFPGDTLGPGFLKAVRGPLPHAPLMPTGGVDLSNLGEWVKAGALAVGVGSVLTAPAASEDYPGVTARAKEFLAAYAAARKGA